MIMGIQLQKALETLLSRNTLKYAFFTKFDRQTAGWYQLWFPPLQSQHQPSVHSALYILWSVKMKNSYIFAIKYVQNLQLNFTVELAEYYTAKSDFSFTLWQAGSETAIKLEEIII